MKILTYLTLLLLGFYLASCSMPTSSRYSQIYSYTKEVKVVKGGFGSNSKYVSIKDFRENDAYDEDIDSLKKEAEEYILLHPEIGEQVKNNLRQLKVTEGSSKDETSLLLGKPLKILETKNNPYSASELWIYRISKKNAVTFFIVPFLLVNEGYYLYFKDNSLAAIERHYIKQQIETSSLPAIEKKKE